MKLRLTEDRKISRKERRTNLLNRRQHLIERRMHEMWPKVTCVKCGCESYERSCHSSAPATPDVCGRDRRSNVRLTDTTDTGTQSSLTPRCSHCRTFSSHTLQSHSHISVSNDQPRLKVVHARLAPSDIQKLHVPVASVHTRASPCPAVHSH